MVIHLKYSTEASQAAQAVKNPPANAEDAENVGSISGLGRAHGEGNGNLLQYSCLKYHKDGEPVGYSPSGCRELGTTERLSTHYSVRCLFSLFFLEESLSNVTE